MKFKTDYLFNYLKVAPFPLALERNMECRILSRQNFERPILDIGCGEGLFAKILFDEKIDVGIDPNKSELNRAKQFDMYEELICCYGDNILKPDKSFNSIFSNSVLEHIPDLEPVLKEANRLLSDSGNFYVTLPTNLFDQYSVINQIFLKFGLTKSASKYRKFYNTFWRHYHFYDERGWTEIFERNGFTVLSSFRYGAKSDCVLNDFLVPFTIPAYLIKKLFNVWTLFPGIRSIIIKPLSFLLSSNRKNNDIPDGGLIFFHLKKK